MLTVWNSCRNLRSLFKMSCKIITARALPGTRVTNKGRKYLNHERNAYSFMGRRNDIKTISLIGSGPLLLVKHASLTTWQ